MWFLIDLLIKTCIETFHLTGVIIVFGLVLGILRTHSIKNFIKSFGVKSVMVTGIIGVPVHELSHAIVALLFGHKITDMKLLQKPDEKGIMGYVIHTFNRLSIYQQIGNFFIGIAPIFGGVFSITALMHYIIPHVYNQFEYLLIKNPYATNFNIETVERMINSYMGLFRAVFSLRNFENPYFYIFLFVSICISSHISLSSADIKGASKGLGIIFLLLLLLNIAGLSKYISEINIVKYNIFITGLMFVSVFLSAITYLISLLLVVIKGSGLFGECFRK